MKISVADALSVDAVFIDTRSPKEYAEDHLPNAVNIPILSNEERSIVGTLYKQVSKKEAIDKGVGFFCEKLPIFISEIRKYRDKKLIINCWRGGMRSLAVATLLKSMGYDVLQLEGGYKSFRKYVRERLYHYKFKPKIIVIWGLTCTGKTKLLGKLKNSLDLEDLAQHRSSVFGAIGLHPNSQKRFENLLLRRLDDLADQDTVFVEGESRKIGNIVIPDELWRQMRDGRNILVTRKLDQRAKHAVSEYIRCDESAGDIREVADSLRKTISMENKKKAIGFIDNKDYISAAKVLLQFYYDPLYSHSLRKIEFDAEICSDDLHEAVVKLRSFALLESS